MHRRCFLVLLVLSALSLAGCSDRKKPESTEKPSVRDANVLLITMDTTRPDYLSCYNPKAASTPSIDGIRLLPGVAVTDVSAIGVVLLQQYLLPFEISSVLLLAAMIGAIVMARKERSAPEQMACEEDTTPIAVDEDEAVKV
jgi:hypothetical protein